MAILASVIFKPDLKCLIKKISTVIMVIRILLYNYLCCFVFNSVWCLHSLHHWWQGKKDLPSTQSLRQASEWVTNCYVYSSGFSILLCTGLRSCCGRVTFGFTNLYIPFSPLLCFWRQLCEKLWDLAGRGRLWREQSQLPRTQRLVGIYITSCLWACAHVCVCLLETEW